MTAHESPAQRQYLAARKRRRIIIRILRILLFLLLLSLWEGGAALGKIDTFLFGSPSRIAGTFFDMLKGENLLTDIGVTLLETLASFALVFFLGVGCAVVLWLLPDAAAVVEPCLIVLNSLPKSALAPLLIVWLGSGWRTVTVAGISVALFGTILNMYTGFSGMEPDNVKLIRTLGGTRKDILLRCIFPASLPLLYGVMKVNIGLCLVGVVIGEFIGARRGLGHLIIYASQVFQLDRMLMAILLLCLIAMGLYGALGLVRKRFFRWQS